MKHEQEYETGYAKPPKSGQFPKGKSGNPRGRPKGSKDFGTDLREVLEAKVAVSENGKPRKVTSQKATLMRLREKALQGNLRAMDKLIDLAKEQGAEEGMQRSERRLNQTEEGILDRFQGEILKAHDRVAAKDVPLQELSNGEPGHESN